MATKSSPSAPAPKPKHPAFISPGQSLGINEPNPRLMIKRLEKGLPYSAVTNLAKASGFPLETIAQVVQVPTRTLARRKKEKRLDRLESERLLRFGMVFEHTLTLFNGNRAAANHWLSTPAKALGGETPLKMTQTEIGAHEVQDLIGRLEHGVFT